MNAQALAQALADAHAHNAPLAPKARKAVLARSQAGLAHAATLAQISPEQALALANGAASQPKPASQPAPAPAPTGKRDRKREKALAALAADAQRVHDAAFAAAQSAGKGFVACKIAANGALAPMRDKALALNARMCVSKDLVVKVVDLA